MPRSMTAQEKVDYKRLFPGLDVNAAQVSGEATEIYNCIAWTVGITDRWIWPGNSIATFDTFYRQFGYSRSSNGPIAAWGASTTQMTHGCVTGSGHGPRWESKCGRGLRIQHGLTELEGSSYGRVLAFYAISTADAPFSKALSAAKKTRSRGSMELSKSEKAMLATAVALVPQGLRKSFKSAFEAWKKTWFEGRLAIISDPYARAAGQEFEALIALGPNALPLVVDEMVQTDSFIAVVLYDFMQSDARLVVQFEPDDPRVLLGEQARAVAAARAWLAR